MSARTADRVIDAHQHFWRYEPSQYPWMTAGQEVLRRDHLPEELARLMAAAGVDATVAVQARRMLAETEWLLAVAEERSFVLGVVGWFDLASPDVEADLERLANHPRLVGGRELIHDMPSLDYAISSDHVRGVASFGRHGLAYDLLLRPEHLLAATQLADLLPDQRFVVDHIAKPPISTGALEPWATGMRELARRENVYCKLSGMMTEAASGPAAAADLSALAEPYMDVCLEAFGPGRLMMGTDWPVCTVVADYESTVGVVRNYASRLSSDERAQIMGATCARFYGLADLPDRNEEAQG